MPARRREAVLRELRNWPNSSATDAMSGSVRCASCSAVDLHFWQRFLKIFHRVVANRVAADREVELLSSTSTFPPSLVMAATASLWSAPHAGAPARRHAATVISRGVNTRSEMHFPVMRPTLRPLRGMSSLPALTSIAHAIMATLTAPVAWMNVHSCQSNAAATRLAADRFAH
jgi:hypothetical protein